MIQIYVNEISVLVPANISALEACETLGIFIPRFCYHERLNVAGNCRMCLVEIEKAPKPIASCAYPVAPNMKIYTNTPMVHKARENVLEFLLVNHPLDCPICDQGGECDLQEQTFIFGSDRSRFAFTKRGVEDKNCGPLVKTIMTRCIHCTRCVRFFQDIAGKEDFGTTLRGRETEIGSYINKLLTSELSGNVIDLCPVGALTSKPYAFTARPWEVKSVETIDISDSIGTNIKINFKETKILRILPALNDNLNEEWISDKTRFSFDGLNCRRVNVAKSQNYYLENDSQCREGFELKKFSTNISWKIVLMIFRQEFIKFKPENILFIIGNNTDLETLHVLKEVSQRLGISLISETFSVVDNNLMSLVKLNTVFFDILNSDLCLTVGTNVRFEASLLNVRIKKRIRRGQFIKASIGLANDYTYADLSIGNSLKTLISIAEGKHVFCRNLAKSRKPFIVIGMSVKKRLDSYSVSQLVNNLSKYTKIIDEEWLGINFLPLTSNYVGERLIGIKANNRIDVSKKKFVYCIGMNYHENSFSKINVPVISNFFFEKSFVVCQTPHSELCLKNYTNLLLPSTAFSEKEKTFINLESRVQKTSSAVKSLPFARDDSHIIETLFSSILTDYQVLNCLDLCNDFEKNKKTFAKDLLIYRKQMPLKFSKTPLRNVLSNFFISNAISKNSLTMAKCFTLTKKAYNNFSHSKA